MHNKSATDTQTKKQIGSRPIRSIPNKSPEEIKKIKNEVTTINPQINQLSGTKKQLSNPNIQNAKGFDLLLEPTKEKFKHIFEYEKELAQKPQDNIHSSDNVINLALTNQRKENFNEQYRNNSIIQTIFSEKNKDVWDHKLGYYNPFKYTIDQNELQQTQNISNKNLFSYNQHNEILSAKPIISCNGIYNIFLYDPSVPNNIEITAYKDEYGKSINYYPTGQDNCIYHTPPKPLSPQEINEHGKLYDFFFIKTTSLNEEQIKKNNILKDFIKNCRANFQDKNFNKNKIECKGNKTMHKIAQCNQLITPQQMPTLIHSLNLNNTQTLNLFFIPESYLNNEYSITKNGTLEVNKFKKNIFPKEYLCKDNSYYVTYDPLNESNPLINNDIIIQMSETINTAAILFSDNFFSGPKTLIKTYNNNPISHIGVVTYRGAKLTINALSFAYKDKDILEYFNDDNQCSPHLIESIKASKFAKAHNGFPMEIFNNAQCFGESFVKTLDPEYKDNRLIFSDDQEYYINYGIFLESHNPKFLPIIHTIGVKFNKIKENNNLTFYYKELNIYNFTPEQNQLIQDLIKNSSAVYTKYNLQQKILAKNIVDFCIKNNLKDFCQELSLACKVHFINKDLKQKFDKFTAKYQLIIDAYGLQDFKKNIYNLCNTDDQFGYIFSSQFEAPQVKPLSQTSNNQNKTQDTNNLMGGLIGGIIIGIISAIIAIAVFVFFKKNPTTQHSQLSTEDDLERTQLSNNLNNNPSSILNQFQSSEIKKTTQISN